MVDFYKLSFYFLPIKKMPFHDLFQQIIRPLENPIKSTGHIQILFGNLAPEGSVAKITGKEGLFFSGIAFNIDCFSRYLLTCIFFSTYTMPQYYSWRLLVRSCTCF